MKALSLNDKSVVSYRLYLSLYKKLYRRFIGGIGRDHAAYDALASEMLALRDYIHMIEKLNPGIKDFRAKDFDVYIAEPLS